MKKLLIMSLLVLYLAGCRSSEPATGTPVPATPTEVPVATATATPVPATPTATPRNLTNIEYFEGRRLDIYRPEEGSGPFPTVLVFHGYGGTKGGYTWLGEKLSTAGYAVVIPNWSPLWLSSENGLCSLAWVQANAETYGFDPQRMVAFGHSGGGALAALMAAIDDPGEFLQDCPYDLPAPTPLRGVVTYAGSFVTQKWYLTGAKDLFSDVVMEALKIPPDEGEQIRQALLETPPEHWLTISTFDDAGTHFIHSLPPGWIDGSEPPFLLIHGSDDELMSPKESEAFAAQLEAAGVEVRVKLVPGAKHGLGFPWPGLDETWSATIAFLAQVMK